VLAGRILENGRLIRLKHHHCRGFAAVRQSGVVGIARTEPPLPLPQLFVRLADQTFRPFQRVLGQGALRNLNPGRVPSNCRNPSQRYPEMEMQCARRRLHSRVPGFGVPLRVLTAGKSRVPAPHFAVRIPAPAYFHL